MYTANCAPAARTNRRVVRRPHFKNSIPSANIIKKENAYEISLAIPGFTKENIGIELDENILRIQSNLEGTDTKENYKLNEIDYHSFQRAFRLSKDVDQDNISATMENGILTVTVPIAPETPAKKISIK